MPIHEYEEYETLLTEIQNITDDYACVPDCAKAIGYNEKWIYRVKREDCYPYAVNIWDESDKWFETEEEADVAARNYIDERRSNYE